MSEVIAPLLDRVLVEPIDSESIRPSGLIIPAAAREKSLRGHVLAVGPGGPDIHGVTLPMNVNVGDLVMFTRYGGTELECDGRVLVVFNIRDILAVVREA